MNHVTGRLAAWLGGELDAAGAAALEAHLEACPDCRREADAQRAVWLALAGEVAAGARPASVWPAVRERTFGQRPAGWFFGRSPAARWSLAAGTLALGILCGRLGGGLAGPKAALADDDSGLAAVWQEDSSWHGDTGGGLSDSWLALAGTGNDGTQGGTK